MPLLFLIGIDLPGLIIILIIIGSVIFLVQRFILKRLTKSQSSKINRIALVTASAFLFLLTGYIVLISVINNSVLPFRENLFDQPQPEGAKEVVIPKLLYGQYLSSTDSAYLMISEKEIIIRNISNLNFSLMELDSADRLNLKDTIYRDGNESMTVKVKNDSVYQRTISFDTLHRPSEKHVLKEVNGYYFINKPLGIKWTVLALRLSGDEVILNSMLSKDEIAILEDPNGSNRSKREIRFIKIER